ncbi:hypothetical protein [Bdellovibrio sp. HCB337]|uniref:hypothetical protein n=1 Tax=Bdellovibrio sp. HCB337 TaxID=3394358 RepID=UPI0039A730F3
MKWLTLAFATLLFVACDTNKENLPGSYKLAPSTEEKDSVWKKSYSMKQLNVTSDKTTLGFVISEAAKWDLDSHKGQLSYSLSVKNEKPVMTLKVSIGETESSQSQILNKDAKTPQSFSVLINDVKVESAIMCREESCKTLVFSVRTIRQHPDIKFNAAAYVALWEMSENDGVLRIEKVGHLEKYDSKDLYNNPYFIFDSLSTSTKLIWQTY